MQVGEACLCPSQKRLAFLIARLDGFASETLATISLTRVDFEASVSFLKKVMQLAVKFPTARDQFESSIHLLVGKQRSQPCPQDHMAAQKSRQSTHQRMYANSGHAE